MSYELSLNLSSQSSPKSVLMSQVKAVQDKYRHEVADTVTLSNIAYDLRFIPEPILEEIEFEVGEIDFIQVYTRNLSVTGLVDAAPAIKWARDEAVKINNKRRGDYQAGKKFMQDFKMLFEFYTGQFLDCEVDLHVGEFVFKPTLILGSIKLETAQ